MRRIPRIMLAGLEVLLLLGASRSVAEVEGDVLPEDTTITMHRRGCERRCAVYRVVIFGDGQVIFDGEHYVRRTLVAKTQVKVEEVKKLVQAFTGLNYLDLSDAYGYKGKACSSMKASDEQMVITSIVSGSRGKSIAHHHGCLGDIPQRLTALENQIDTVAKTVAWLK